jgi:hypothetical protein
MVKCTFLLPLHDNAGNVFDALTINGILDMVAEKFGGYTSEGEVFGTYRMLNEKIVKDRSLKIVCCVPACEVGDLKRLVSEFGSALGQETMYFEKSLSNVTFPPSLRGTRLIPVRFGFAKGTAGIGLNCPDTASEKAAPTTAKSVGQLWHERPQWPEDKKPEKKGFCAPTAPGKAAPKYREFNGELPSNVVAFLKSCGCDIYIYRHKGTVATVVHASK